MGTGTRLRHLGGYLSSMSAIVQRLRRIRGKSLRELRVRGAQEISKISERALRGRTGEVSDAAFERMLTRRGRGNVGMMLEQFRNALESGRPGAANSSAGSFFACVADRNERRAVFSSRFREARDVIIQRAARAINGRIEILGLGEIDYGRSINWRLEPSSGKRTHLGHWSTINYLDRSIAGDKKVTWELNRHKHFVTLGQAYYLTGDEAFASAFVSQAVSWIEQNPVDRGINWASSLEVALRCIAWLWTLHLLSGSRSLTSEFLLKTLKLFAASGRHLEKYLSHYFSPNTHLTGEALGLFYLGTFLPQLTRARSWQTTGVRILIEQLDKQIRADGVHFEQSTCYHRYTTDFYLHLLLIARAARVAVPDAVTVATKNMLEHLLWITRPDGTTPLIGDDDGGRLIALGYRPANDFRDTIAIGAAMFGRADLKAIAGEAPAELFWLLGTCGLSQYDSIEAQAPDGNCRAFPSSGFYVMRDGWNSDSSYAVVTCGPNNGRTGAHAHADALAFEFASRGRPRLVDAGTFTYTADPDERDYFRTTAAHNTVTVDDQSQSVPASVFSWSSQARGASNQFVAAERFTYFEGTHDGYFRLADPVRHTRGILMLNSEQSDGPTVPSYVLVQDSFLARVGHRYTIRYHLPPNVTAIASGNRVLVADADETRFYIGVFSRRRVATRIEQSWISRGYLDRKRALAAVFEIEGFGAEEVTTFLIPMEKRAWITVEPRSTNLQSARGFRVASANALDLIVLGDGVRAVKCGSLTATARLAWGRWSGSQSTSAGLIDGTLLSSSDGLSLSCSGHASHCSIGWAKDAVDLVIQTSQSPVPSRAATLVVNGSTFDLGFGRNRVAPARDGSGWRLTHAG